MEIQLETYGHLDGKSAKLYMELLRKGELSIAGLTRETGIKRSTVYLHLEDLSRKGFVEKVVRGKRLHYRAANPKRLLTALEREKQGLEVCIPELSSMYERRHKEPVVRVFSGKTGLSDIYRIVESEALWVKTLFSPSSFYTVFTEVESRAFAQTLDARQTKMQSLLVNDSTSRRLMRHEEDLHHSLKLLPKEYVLPINVLLWSRSVALISYEHLYGVIIENESIAKYHELQFDFLWESAKKGARRE